MQVVKPPKLHRGDTIGIVAPSMPVLPDYRAQYERGKQILQAMGFRMIEGKTIGLQRNYSAGTPAQQAADITTMFADPSIKAIIAATGGHSAIGVLEHINYDVIRANPKPFIGMSDVTTYHLAFLAKTGLVGFHMDEVTWGIGTVWQKAPTAITDLFLRVLTSPEPLGELPAHSPRESWRQGQAEGRLIGGILTLVATLVGTPYFPSLKMFDGAILFWESTGRSIPAMRRALFQLKYAGVFDRIGGMAIGSLTNTKPLSENGITEPSIKEMVLEVTNGYTFPIIAGLDFGHYTANVPMPLGITARFSTSDLSFALTEGAVH